MTGSCAGVTELLLAAILVGVVVVNVVAVAVLPRTGQLREPVPALDREGDRRRGHDLRDHQRRDRPLGRLGDGVLRRACWPPCTRAARSRSRVAVVVALLAGAGAGLLHGLFVARMGLPSLVVTLAGLIGFRGAARILVEDRSIGDFPEWFDRLGQDPLVGRFSLAFILFVVGIVVGRRRAPAHGVRPLRLRDRQQRRGRPLLGDRRRPGQAGPADHVGLRGRAGRGAVRRPARLGPRQPRPRASSSTSSRWCCSEG